MHSNSRKTGNLDKQGNHSLRLSSRPALREVQNSERQNVRPGAIKKSLARVSTFNAETQTSGYENPPRKTNEIKVYDENNTELNELLSANNTTITSSSRNSVYVKQFAARITQKLETAADLSISETQISNGNRKRFLYEDKEERFSPIRPNEGAKENILITRYAEEPAQKKTLLRAKKLRKERRDESSNAGDIYNSIYLIENLQELRRIDQKYIGTRYFLQKHNTELNVFDRSKILYWVLTIEDKIKLNHYVYFKFVRLFDHILENVYVPRNMLQLVAITACWILMKVHEVEIPSVNKLIHLCGGAYTIQQFIEMEVKLLKLTRFNLSISSPSDFFYFLVDAQEIDKPFIHCINYILDNFAFNVHYSQYNCSEVADAAMYLAAHYLKIDTSSLFKLNKRANVSEIIFLMDSHLRQMYATRKLNDFEYLIYKNYAVAECQQISRKLAEFLVKDA